MILTREQRHQVTEHLDNGMTIAQIAIVFDVSTKTIYRIRGERLQLEAQLLPHSPIRDRSRSPIQQHSPVHQQETAPYQPQQVIPDQPPRRIVINVSRNVDQRELIITIKFNSNLDLNGTNILQLK